MRVAHWQADPGWRSIDLLSDVHLHADAPRTYGAWRAHLLDSPSDAVLILGDLFEVWVGDDAAHNGFERDCVEVLQQASRRKALAFMRGNRDFLLGEDMAGTCRMQLLDDPTVATAWGQRLLLSHGDALCLADADYQRFRAEVRGAAWQRDFLALPLAERRRRARTMRDASSAHQAAMGAGEWSDVDAQAAALWLERAGCDVLVHGHTHRPARHVLGAGRARHVLGDWDFDHTPQRARILRWTREGLTPLDLGTA